MENGCKWTMMRHGKKIHRLGRPADQRKVNRVFERSGSVPRNSPAGGRHRSLNRRGEGEARACELAT